MVHIHCIFEHDAKNKVNISYVTDIHSPFCTLCFFITYVCNYIILKFFPSFGWNGKSAVKGDRNWQAPLPWIIDHLPPWIDLTIAKTMGAFQLVMGWYPPKMDGAYVMSGKKSRKKMIIISRYPPSIFIGETPVRILFTRHDHCPGKRDGRWTVIPLDDDPVICSAVSWRFPFRHDGVPQQLSSISDWDFPVHKNHPAIGVAPFMGSSPVRLCESFRKSSPKVFPGCRLE